MLENKLKFIKNIIAIFIFVFSFSFCISTNAEQTKNFDKLFDSAFGGKTEGIDKITTKANYNTNTSATSMMNRVLQAGLGFSAVFALFLVVFAGIKYIFVSKGNPGEIKKSMNLLITGVIGLVLIISAYAITTFVLSQIKNISGTQEQIDK
jgi:hypothetical protein